MIKTSTGRRVSPVSAESALRGVKGIDQALVVGDTRPFLVALCACEGPQGADARRNLERACIEAMASLAPMERPRAIGFIERPFQIASGEITANLKLRRKAIAMTHAALIDSLYSALPPRQAAAEVDIAFVW